MSSFTFADNKTGGRLMAACDAIAAGKLRTAAGILNELGGELNLEAENSDGLMADEGDLMVAEWPVGQPAQTPASETLQTDLAPQSELRTQPALGTAMDLQSCARNVHQFGPVDERGWRTCQSCGQVNVAPPDNNGPVDMSAR